MSNSEDLAPALLRPVFSPRAEMSRYLQDVEKSKTSLAINIDKETLSLLKNQFELHSNQLNKVELVACGLKVLNSWQKDLPYRQSRMVAYLSSLFDQTEDKIDNERITWEQFNNLIIEKALNLKSLQSHDIESLSQFKKVNWSRGKAKVSTPIQKILCIDKQKKLAYLCEESNRIQFLSSVSSMHNYRPLVMDRQDLIVQKSFVKRVKDQANGSVVKQNCKKEVVVSGFSITFLDMIYVSNQKYEMLITSSSDSMIRGWDIRGTVPVLAKQPENEQEKMMHQFQVEIHSMAWDEINDVLYCSAKNNKVYLWVVKTDSEKELSDPEGHNTMISSMIMIPKLQFLATGDYEGKLILWDTISLTKKYKYEQHTRSIVSMTFHQALILLFTASFDHSICVWNPYIPSLIYKISCNVNVLQVYIIPGTNYLAALDSASNLKIREINKFNMISNYVVDRPEEAEVKPEDGPHGTGVDNEGFFKIEPTCMAVSERPTRFYFAGNSIKCMQFDENEGLASSEYYPAILRYCQARMRLYVVVKNLIYIWDMLTGQLYDTFQNQAEQEITVFEIVSKSAKFVVGDSQGSLYLRKLENGIKISKLYKHKHKAAAQHLVCKRGGVWNDSVIACCFQDGQIVVFGKDESGDYGLLRTTNVKKIYPSMLVQSLQYEEKRNTLIIGTSLGDIICLDVDKNRVTNHIETGFSETIKLVIKYDAPLVLAYSRNGEIFGLFLPPHAQKYKSSCNLQIQTNRNEFKAVCVAISKKSDHCFVAYENGSVLQVVLGDQQINNPQSLTTKYISQTSAQKTEPVKLYEQWEVKLQELPKDMLLIVEEQVLAVILYGKNITLLAASTGQVLNVLPSYGFNAGTLDHFYTNPLCYYSDKQVQAGSEGRDKHRQFEIRPQLCVMNRTALAPGQTQYDRDLQVFHNPYYLHQQYVAYLTQAATHEVKQENRKKQPKSVKFKQTSSMAVNIYHNSSNNNSNNVSLKSIQSIAEPKYQVIGDIDGIMKRAIWNKDWKICPEFRQEAVSNIQEIKNIYRQVHELMAKPNKRQKHNSEEKTKAKLTKNSSVSVLPHATSQSLHANIQRALNAQKKWELIKLQLDEDALKKNKPANQTQGRHSKLADQKETAKLDTQQAQQHERNHRESNASVLITKHKSLYKNESSPFIRLGLALQKINEKDEKATRFIQMGEKQKKVLQLSKNVKLPKIGHKP